MKDEFIDEKLAETTLDTVNDHQKLATWGQKCDVAASRRKCLYFGD